MSQVSIIRPSLDTSRNLAAQPILFWMATLVIGFAFMMAEHHLQHEERTLEIKEPTRSRQIGVASVGLLGCVLLVAPGGRRLRFDDTLARSMLALSAVAVASLLWSDDASFTVRRLASAVLFGVCVLGICRHLRPSDFCRLVLLTCLCFLGMGVLAEIAGRGFVMEGQRYRFGGTVNPNLQGTYCAFMALSAICMHRTATKHRKLLRGILLVAVGFLILTGSRTALYSFVIAVFAYFWLTTVFWKKAIVMTGGAAALALLLVAYELFVGTSADGLLGMLAMGRDVDTIWTLTSRLPVWEVVLPYISERPVLGFGYQGFWSGDRMFEMTDFAGWSPGSAHNAFLETVLGLGLVGGSLHVFVLLLGLARARSYFLRTADAGYGFIFCVLMFAAVHSMAESAFSKPLYPGLVFVTGLGLLAFQSLRWPAGTPARRMIARNLRGHRLDHERDRNIPAAGKSPADSPQRFSPGGGGRFLGDDAPRSPKSCIAPDRLFGAQFPCNNPRGL